MSIRVLVADDSLTVRQRIVEALSGKPEFQVVGQAADGKQAIELCQDLKPDVMTLDMVMPVMSGLAATEYLMAICPTPILIVSASTNRGDLFKTYEALAAGAVDVLDKASDDMDEGWDERLAAALRMVAQVKVFSHLRRGEPQAPMENLPWMAPRGALRAVCIGASTGGPGAVLALLRGLPKDFPLPVLLVMHLPKGFDQALAAWLDGESPLRSAFAQDGQALPPVGQGCVLMASPDRHLVLRQGCLWLDQGEERHFNRPSVDVLFESVAAELGSAAVACLLTGRGHDGAAGLLALRRAGALCLVQDQSSSVDFGMAGEAVRLNAVDQILPLEKMAPFLTALALGDRA